MNLSTDTRPAVPLCPLATRYTYHVVVSAACMPSSCWGVYQRVGVVEVDHHERAMDYVPTRVADVHGCKVIETWERLSVGTTDACAVALAKVDARETALACRVIRAAQASADTGAVIAA